MFYVSMGDGIVMAEIARYEEISEELEVLISECAHNLRKGISVEQIYYDIIAGFIEAEMEGEAPSIRTVMELLATAVAMVAIERNKDNG